MHYPARFAVASEGGYVVTFMDIPEAITQGDDMEEALAMARDALSTAMDFYLEEKRPVPSPSQRQTGEILVELSPDLSAKIMSANEARPASPQ